MAQRMSLKEKAALDRYLDAASRGEEVDDPTSRQAMGVLRRLWPEYYEQLLPRRGRQANNDRRHGVISRFAVLTNPRMRDEAMNRAYTPQEAVEKIAAEFSLSVGYVRELLADEFASIKREKQERQRQRDDTKQALEREQLADEQRRANEAELERRRAEEDRRNVFAEALRRYEGAFRAEILDIMISAGFPTRLHPHDKDNPAPLFKYLENAGKQAMMEARKIAVQFSSDEQVGLDSLHERLRDEYLRRRTAAFVHEKLH